MGHNLLACLAYRTACYFRKLGIPNAVTLCQPLKDFILKELSETGADGEGNYIERNFAEIEKSSDNPQSSFHGRRGQVHMLGAVFDLFIAGMMMRIQTILS